MIKLMVARIKVIDELESLLQQCFSTLDDLLSIQKISQNDARVTFFKHIVNVIDSSIIFLTLSHRYFGDEPWWSDTQRMYNLSTRPIPFDREFDYCDQMISMSYFFFLFSSFEHSIRRIIHVYNPALYNSQPDLSSLLKRLIKNLSLENQDQFIDLITSIRNSIHNNGLYIPRGISSTRRIIWKSIPFHFDKNKSIEMKDLWLHWINISKEIISIFNRIINSEKIKKIRYYPDPTELSQ